MNFRSIYKVIGQLLFLEAAILLVCLIISICYGEDDMVAFTVATLVTLGSGLGLRWLGRNSNDTLSRRDAYLVVSLTWVIFSLFGVIPFMISGRITSFTDAFFETMSGFSTTGATIIDDILPFPHALKFWRTVTQWIGGLGIVFFTIALLPSLVEGSVKVFAAEATGPMHTKLHPKLSTSAKWIWTIYVVITLACFFTYYILGMTPFEALNYAMTTTATGGFAIHNNSTEYFRSPAIEYACIAFCFLSGVNFTLLYLAVVKRRIKNLMHSAEFRVYTGMIVVCTVFIMLELLWRNGYGIEKALRSALFQVVSFATTTGLFNDDAGQWPHVTWVVLALCMALGGCSGSTAGGIKSIRAVMMWKSIQGELRQLLHPNAVLPMRIDGANVTLQKRVTLLAFVTIYALCCLIGSFAMIAMGIDSVNSITISLSCLSNVGPSLGLEIGPTMSWSELPAAAKWICSLLMLVGRLEFFSVLVIFTPSFWKGN